MRSTTGGGDRNSISRVIPSALRAIRKTAKSCIPYEKVPCQLLSATDEGGRLDLSQWSLVATDDCIRTISCHNPFDIVYLNLSGADAVTDDGIQSLSNCSNLQELNLDNIFRLQTGLSKVTEKCRAIRDLSLCGCFGLKATQVASLGQNARGLVSLKLSGCRQITPWAFAKLFEGLKLLESLDISYCSLVTDQEIKLLSESARGLKHLNLRECKLVSDIGLTFLSQGCTELVDLNLRRSELPFRVTDVALLQIGQGCQSLQALNLHGCELISDTGLSWLAGWAKQLRHVNLTNCTKITNAGVRHLGDGCPKLISAVLTNVKRVSDVGLRCLANGCSALETLNCSGLSMLSDGVNREFGLEGLQALGASSCSSTVGSNRLLTYGHTNLHLSFAVQSQLRNLNVRGCTLISTLSMRAISKFANLERLDLSSNNKLTVVGAKCIGRACRKLTHLSLSSCGDCICNGIVDALISGQINLVSTNLSSCKRITSLKALATCRSLQSVDLTNCSGITDEAVLQLTEGAFEPGLKALHLVKCSKITDTTLSWLGDGLKLHDGTITLETLSVKYTKISLAGLKGLQDRLEYSSLRHNESFLGFWCLSRLDDRRAISLFRKREMSATAIQALVRTRHERDTLRRAREAHCRKKVAVLLGAQYRGGRARVTFRELKSERRRKLFNALRLQCAFRCRIARKRLSRQRERRWLSVAPMASTAIQRIWRGILGRRLAERARIRAQQDRDRRVQASVSIQCWHRVNRAKKSRTRLLCLKLTRELRRLRAATLIQAAWRMRLGAKHLKRLRLAWHAQRAMERSAAEKIAAAYRRVLFRREVLRRIFRTRRRLEGSKSIQKWYRQERARVWHNLVVAQELRAARLRASQMIQRRVRQRLALVELMALRRKRDEEIALREGKAALIGRFGRLCLAKIRVGKRRAEFEEEVRQFMAVKVWSSTTIASAWRGKKGRDRAREASLAKVHRWKQLWSEEDGALYYYNKDTGQTTWTKPQRLLDMEPRPVCCNCSSGDTTAAYECAACDEFFCSVCFEFIHRNGKRRLHKFRPLYDYYGRRKDYNTEPWKSLSDESNPQTASSSFHFAT